MRSVGWIRVTYYEILQWVNNRVEESYVMNLSARKSTKENIECALVLSTAHITERTSEILTSDAIDGLVAYPKGEYGFFVYVPEESSEGISDCPKDLMACIEAAKERGCEWLMLERDAETMETLPTYDW